MDKKEVYNCKYVFQYIIRHILIKNKKYSFILTLLKGQNKEFFYCSKESQILIY